MPWGRSRTYTVHNDLSRMFRGPVSAGPPPNPTDGDIWIATDVLPGITGGNAGHSGNVVGPITWMFQYDADYAVSASKWQFIGGPPLEDYKTPATTDTNTFAPSTWGSCTGSEPGVYIPRAGEYVLEFGINQMWTTPVANTLCGAGYYNGPGAGQNDPANVLSVWPGSDGTYHAGSTKWPAAMPNIRDGYVMFQQQQGAGAQTITCGFRWLAMTPIRVS